MCEHVPVDMAQDRADFQVKKTGALFVFRKAGRMQADGHSVIVDGLVGVSRAGDIRIGVVGERQEAQPLLAFLVDDFAAKRGPGPHEVDDGSAIEAPIVGTIIFFLLREPLAPYGTWYLILLGVTAVAVMLKAPKGLWGLFAERFDIALFPVQRRLLRGTDDKPG